MIQRDARIAHCLMVMAIALISLLFTGSAGAHMGTQKIELAGHGFEIPKRYILQEPPLWLRLFPEIDSGSREILLMIDADEVAAAVPTFKPKYKNYKDDLQIRLVVLSDDERRRYLDPDQFSDIWNDSGQYRDRVIKVAPKTGFVRVYRKVEYPNSWEVFSVSPTTSPLPADVFSFWLAHCLKAHSPLTPSGRIVNCDSYAVVGDIAINFRTTEQNLDAIPALRKYLRDLVSTWRDGKGRSPVSAED